MGKDEEESARLRQAHECGGEERSGEHRECDEEEEDEEAIIIRKGETRGGD